MRDVSGSTLRLQPTLPRWPTGPVSRLTIYWLIFSVSICAFLLDYLAGARYPSLGVALHIVGLVPCGFAWLFARALFRPQTPSGHWPEWIVATLFLSCLILYLDPSDSRSGWLGYIAQLQKLIGSAMLLLTMVEALDGKRSTRKERQFRYVFAGGYAALVATSFLFVLPELSAWLETAQAAMATLALIGGALAWQYRSRHPIPGVRHAAARVVAQPDLAAAIRRLLTEERVYLDPTIKVAGLAARLGLPDYKVSQCIVNDLGYRNFNQLVNEYRLGEARRRLAEPAHASTSILVIAMDCGFGSLGPFNRAFKAQTGVTPTAFRKRALSATQDT